MWSCKKVIVYNHLDLDADELVNLLNSKGIKVGLLTRNGRKSMEHTISLFTGKIDLAYCRDIQPSKPHVDPFVQISKEWGIPCENLLLAGDHLDDFIASIGRKSCYELIWSTALLLLLCTFAGNDAVAHAADCTRWSFSCELPANSEVHWGVQEDPSVLHSRFGGGVDFGTFPSMERTLEDYLFSDIFLCTYECV